MVLLAYCINEKWYTKLGGILIETDHNLIDNGIVRFPIRGELIDGKLVESNKYTYVVDDEKDTILDNAKIVMRLSDISMFITTSDSYIKGTYKGKKFKLEGKKLTIEEDQNV